MVDIETYRARIGNFSASSLSTTTLKLKIKLRCKVQGQVSVKCSVQTLIFLWMVVSTTTLFISLLYQEHGNTSTGIASSHTDSVYSDTQLCMKYLFKHVHEFYWYILENYAKKVTEMLLLYTLSRSSTLSNSIWKPGSIAQLVVENIFNRTVHGTCSYLIGNVGSHAYHGNPPKRSGENIYDLHRAMVLKLSQTIAPSTDNKDLDNKWSTFTYMLLGPDLLNLVEVAGLKNMFDVFVILMEKRKIDYGNYDVVKKILSQLQLMQCHSIITEHEKRMASISQDGQHEGQVASTSQDGQHEGPMASTSQDGQHEGQMASISQDGQQEEENRSLQKNMNALAKYPKGFGNAEPVYSQITAGPSQNKMPSGTAEIVYSRDTAGSSQNKMPSVDMEATVKVWEDNDRLCYETKGIKDVVQRISGDKHSYICVVGEPGSGKSTAIRHAALYLKDKCGFTIYPVLGPKQFLDYLDRDKKRAFVIDDYLGKYFLDQDKLKVWNEYNEKIKDCLQVHKNTKFLFSLRIQLYSELKSKGNAPMCNDQRHVINFSDKGYKLNRGTMKAMLRHYLQVKHVQNIRGLIRRVRWEKTEQFAGCFPLLCKGFSEDESVRVNPEKYFSDPLPVLQNIFKRIKSENKHQFCGLLLCGITELKDEYFSSLSELKKPKHFNILIKSQKLNPETDLEDIKQSLDNLDGVYISHIGNRYTFLHSVFQNIVTFLYDDKYYVFKYATRDFIHERVRLFSKFDTDDDYVKVFYGDDCVELLVDRMIEELQSDDTDWWRYWERVEFIVKSHYIDNKELITCLMEKLFDSEHTPITQDKIHELFGKCLEAVCLYTLLHPHTDETSCPQYQLSLSLIPRCDCNRQIEWWGYLLHAPVMCGLLHVTKALVEHQADVNVIDRYNNCVLHWALRCTNNVDMTKYLLSLPNLKCLNHRDNEGHTPYWYVVNNKLPFYLDDVPHRDELIQLCKHKAAIL